MKPMLAHLMPVLHYRKNPRAAKSECEAIKSERKAANKYTHSRFMAFAMDFAAGASVEPA